MPRNSPVLTNGLLLVAAAPLLAVRLVQLPWVQMPFVLISAVLTLWCIGLAVQDRSGLGVLSPPGLLGLAFGTTVLLPLLYLDMRDDTSHGLPIDYPLAVIANLFLVGTVLVVLSRYRRSDHVLHLRLGCEVNRLALAWLVALAVAGTALLVLLGTTGGTASSFAIALGNRRQAFSGLAWLTWGLVLPAAASLVTTHLAFSSWIALPRRLWKPGVLVGALFLLPIGNRANVVSFAMATVAICVMGRGRRLSLGRQLAIVLLGLVLLSSFLSLFRSGDLADSALEADAPVDQFRQLPTVGYASTFGQLPAAALVTGDTDTPLLLGGTYAAALTMGIPRAIAPWKLPDIGEVVTRSLLPAVWEAGSGVQVGAAGEALANFGLLGVPAVGVAFAYALIRLDRLLDLTSAVSPLVYAVALPRVALFFRGGFASVFALLLFDLVPVLIIARLVRLRVKRCAGSPPAGPAPPRLLDSGS